MLVAIEQRTHSQSGFGLIEVMVSILLVSVGFLGLLNYQQWMARSQIRLWQQQQAWQWSEQAITLHRMGVSNAEIPARLALPNTWWIVVTARSQFECEVISASIRAPLNIQAQLERTICSQLME